MISAQHLHLSMAINIALFSCLLCAVTVLQKLKGRYRTLQLSENELNKLLLIEKELYEVNQYREITNNIYNNILEADITKNKLIGENSRELLMQLGLPEEATFSQCIDTIIEKFIKEGYHDLYRESFGIERLLERYNNGEKMFTFEFIEKADLVNYCWTRVTVCIYYSEVTKTVKIISYVKNIQEEKEIELALKEKATTDSLTGLLNREGIINRAKDILEHSSEAVAMFMIDIDGFKDINDELGHQRGDKVLVEIGEVIKSIFSEKDAIGRLGGDEFMIIHHYDGNLESIIAKATEICEKCYRSYTEKGIEISVSGSVGISLFPIHGKSFQELYKNADIALYKSKENGKNQYTVFEK